MLINERQTMKTLFKTNDKNAPYGFSFNDVEILNPTISECGRFNVSPEYYGFTIWQTGGGCTAHGQEFLLDGNTVLMLITDKDVELIHVTDETENCYIGLYDMEMDSLDVDVWSVSRLGVHHG
jgi:hypothetical protein